MRIIVNLKVEGNCIIATFPKKCKDMEVGTYCLINESITDWVNDYLTCLGYFVMESKPYGKSKLLISLVRMDPFPLVKENTHPPRNQAGYSEDCDCEECVQYRYFDRRY